MVVIAMRIPTAPTTPPAIARACAGAAGLSVARMVPVLDSNL